MYVARNVLLLTLIIDYTDGSKDKSIWNIYYHLLLDKESLELLHIQAQKLTSLSTSIQEWHTTKYGRLLRMCDQGTLLRVRRIWNSYGSPTVSRNDTAKPDQCLDSQIQKARDMQSLQLGRGMNLTGFRSAAPLSVLALEDLAKLFQHFWKYGVTDTDPSSLSQSKFSNPMFTSSSEDAFTLHYGTDPLLGFHLATAYASLAPGSPFKILAESQSPKAVAAAQLQCQEWSSSFRKCQNKSTIRFFAGDALAFCHTLQHMNTTGDRSQSNWYRDLYHLEPLILDSKDYNPEGNAPLLFNVIDTSNLQDHLGAINLLVATSPLLEHTIFATLYTEALVKKQEDLKKLVDSILCGHFPTLSILFGLIPIEYWTNFTATSSVEEHLFDSVRRIMGDKENDTGQMHSRLTWKRRAGDSAALPTMRFDEFELARILYQVYLNMFQSEDVTQLFSKTDLQTIQNSSLLHYHRGSLASFLCFLKRMVVIDWKKMMSHFIKLVKQDETLLMSSNYLQELYLHLHLHGLYTLPDLGLPIDHIDHYQTSNSLIAWKNIPAIVCITLKVPRTNLGHITKVPLERLGSPILRCTLQSSDSSNAAQQWQNTFASLQLAFGEISISSSRCGEDVKLNVSEDASGWNGHSPLLVSFLAPGSMVRLESQATTVAFGIQATPQSVYTFSKSLGPEMNLYATTLGNENQVYITKYRPNLSGHASVCNFGDPNQAAKKHANEDITTTVKADVDIKTGQISALVGRLTILSGSIKSTLSSGAIVETVQVSPDTIGIAIGKSGPQFRLLFPVPVLRSRSNSRIARKSAYVEVVAPMADPRDGDGFTQFMCPMFPSKGGPVVWNMPRLNLDRLPVLKTSEKEDLQWLNTHASLMMSSRERRLRESSGVKDARVNLKDSLFSMFMHFSGVQGQQSEIFGINNPDDGGIHILIFVSCLRLDLANHTVVLDAAILPLHNPLLRKIEPFLGELTKMGLCSIIADNDELRLWKQILPAWVERCRQWQHRSSCQYLKKSKIPLSTEHGENPLCSCGEGSLPSSWPFNIPRWDLAAKYAVRAAISPCFSVPFVEQSYEGNHAPVPVPDTKTGPMVGTRSKPATSVTKPQPTASTRTEPAPGTTTGCKSCGKDQSDDGGRSLLKCSRCQAVRYCSVECQRQDWPEHKKACAK